MKMSTRKTSANKTPAKGCGQRKNGDGPLVEQDICGRFGKLGVMAVDQRHHELLVMHKSVLSLGGDVGVSLSSGPYYGAAKVTMSTAYKPSLHWRRVLQSYRITPTCATSIGGT